jgi:hypothetical protein
MENPRNVHNHSPLRHEGRLKHQPASLHRTAKPKVFIENFDLATNIQGDFYVLTF